MGSLLAESGPVLWITAPLGLAGLAAALWYATNGRNEIRRLAIRLSLTSLAAGAFGTVTGIRRVLGPILDLSVDRRWIMVLGIRESFTCLTVGLGLAVAVGLLLSIGGFRFERQREPVLKAALSEN